MTKTRGTTLASVRTSTPGDPLSFEKEQQLIDLWAAQARARSAWWGIYQRSQAKGREAIASVTLSAT
jgi:hypothetical protein